MPSLSAFISSLTKKDNSFFIMGGFLFCLIKKGDNLSQQGSSAL